MNIASMIQRCKRHVESDQQQFAALMRRAESATNKMRAAWQRLCRTVEDQRDALNRLGGIGVELQTETTGNACRALHPFLVHEIEIVYRTLQHATDEAREVLDREEENQRVVLDTIAAIGRKHPGLSLPRSLSTQVEALDGIARVLRDELWTACGLRINCWDAIHHDAPRGED